MVVRWSDDIEQAAWIGPRLAPFDSGRVDSVVPAGFEAYARLLHPVEDDRPVRWHEVAQWSGLPLGRQTQFHDIALPEQDPVAPAPWRNAGPAVGTLTTEDARVLVELLRPDAAGKCWFCVWAGYGWDNKVVVTWGDGHTSACAPSDPVPAAVRAGPQVRLPARDYLLYTGPVEEALAFSAGEGQTANLWWPDDRSWCVASEIDLPWTYFGGPRELVDRVLAEPRLEALPTEPADNHHLRVAGRLAERIATALSELLSTGSATITTSRGTIHARLRQPTRLREGLRRAGHRSEPRHRPRVRTGTAPQGCPHGLCDRAAP